MKEITETGLETHPTDSVGYLDFTLDEYSEGPRDSLCAGNELGFARMQSLETRINGPLAVIGDVHGQTDKLLAVVEKLRTLPDYDSRWIVFIGDLVDRGPDSKGTMDIVCDLLIEHQRTTVVAGNHDLAMAAALGLIPTPDYSNWSERWLDHYDSESTFDSYGVEFGDLSGLVDQLPKSHQELLSELPWCVEHPQYLFVHAGLDPNTPFEMQVRILREKDFTLNRPPWLCSKSFVDSEIGNDCPLTVVSGHVKIPNVVFRHKRILVDTTGGFSGDLSCVLLPDNLVITSGDIPAEALVPVGPSRPWWKIWS